MSVRRAQMEVSANEFAEWCALDEIEPWGTWRDDFRAATIASAAASAFGGKASTKDFMPDFDKQPPTPQEVADRVKMLVAAMKRSPAH